LNWSVSRNSISAVYRLETVSTSQCWMPGRSFLFHFGNWIPLMEVTTAIFKNILMVDQRKIVTVSLLFVRCCSGAWLNMRILASVFADCNPDIRTHRFRHAFWHNNGNEIISLFYCCPCRFNVTNIWSTESLTSKKSGIPESFFHVIRDCPCRCWRTKFQPWDPLQWHSSYSCISDMINDQYHRHHEQDDIPALSLNSNRYSFLTAEINLNICSGWLVLGFR